jgi:hypothetical protein
MQGNLCIFDSTYLLGDMDGVGGDGEVRGVVAVQNDAGLVNYRGARHFVFCQRDEGINGYH